MANDNFKDKLINIFGMEDLEDPMDEDYEEDYQEEVMDQQPVQQAPQPSSNYGSADVLVLDPETFDEAPNIVNKLKMNKTIVVNLKQTDFDEGRKIFDFLSGAVFALEGSLNRIAESVFILAPKQVSVSTEMEKPESNYSAQILNWED
ncbi:MAG: cell division protein SepF [Eubacteriaceae bacterium]|jgi:cell division inhibitor SepF